MIENVFRYVLGELMGDENETKDEDQVEWDEAIVHERVKVWLVGAIHVNQYVEFLYVVVNQLFSEIHNKIFYLLNHH